MAGHESAKKEQAVGPTTSAEILAGLRAAQSVQAEYDRAMWDIRYPELANLRHIQIHLAVTVGKVAKLLEPLDHCDHRGTPVEMPGHAELAPVVADLVMHAAQIANIVELDLGEAFAARYRGNATRFAPGSRLEHFGHDVKK